ncbi:MAG TPA: Holliday junction resolvase RuvX [Candidatus Acidoferrales bacterium]|nr:Holliday junction resolvase RuvX [Candidatus Acidoferrales bacterium]
MSRLLGLDVGDRRVGLAVGDDALGVVRPLAVVRRGTPAEDAEHLARVVTEQRVDEIVVGLPLDMDGGEGEQARLTRAWAAEIERRTGLRVAWRDERLTTEAAEAAQPRMRRDRTTGRPTRSAIVNRRARVDRDAAARILQAELDARGRVTEGGAAPSRAGLWRGPERPPDMTDA